MLFRSLCFEALSQWHLGQTTSCQPTIAKAITLAKELNDFHGLAQALWAAAVLANCERNSAEVERLASELIELSMRHKFSFWLTVGTICRGWWRSASGGTVGGITSIEDGISDYRASGTMLGMPFYLALKAEALHLLDRTSEAL